MVFPLIPTLQLAFSLLMDFLQINFLLGHTGAFDLRPSNQLCAVGSQDALTVPTNHQGD